MAIHFCCNKVSFSISLRVAVICILCRFDLSRCTWERLPDMLSQRDYFSAVCLDGKVFALGGNCDDSRYLDVVEYYTPEENTWRYGVTQNLNKQACHSCFWKSGLDLDVINFLSPLQAGPPSGHCCLLPRCSCTGWADLHLWRL